MDLSIDNFFKIPDSRHHLTTQSDKFPHSDFIFYHGLETMVFTRLYRLMESCFRFGWGLGK
jgi:hypothetical protein